MILDVLESLRPLESIIWGLVTLEILLEELKVADSMCVGMVVLLVLVDTFFVVKTTSEHWVQTWTPVSWKIAMLAK